MERIAGFEKVSFSVFEQGARQFLGLETDEARRVYENIALPQRATTGSAGYDFKAPVDIELGPGESITVPTGIRTKINDGWVLMLFPRSGLGIKFGMKLDNTVGVIDSDYYNSDNEGHIIAKITNCSKDKTLKADSGKGFIQGVFMPFGITFDDDAAGVRNGGFGSTN